MRDYLKIIDDENGTILGFQVHRQTLAKKFDRIMSTCEQVLKSDLHVHTFSAKPEWVYITTSSKSMCSEEIPMGIYDPDGHFVSSSSALGRLLDVDCTDLIGDFAYDYVHPDDHERVQKKHHQVLANKEPVTMEYRVKTSNGYTKILTRAIPVVAEDGHVERLIGYHGHVEPNLVQRSERPERGVVYQ